MRVYWDRRCLDHPAPAGFPERPERLRRLLSHLGSAGPGAFEIIEAPADDRRVARRIGRVHDETLLERLAGAVDRGDGLFDSADNPIGAGTLAAVLGAASATLAALDWVIGGAGRRAFAAVRPPGHHAERDRAMGFCFVNNAAVAAHEWHAAEGGVVAVVDFDVHHGNGTQHLFEDRPEVLYVSLHQHPFYPGTGAETERGRGRGAGWTVNVPVPAGTGDARFLEAFDALALPFLERAAPRGLVLSAGFDAWAGDPLGGLRLSHGAFRSLGERLAGVAMRHAEGRALAVLEGGYDVEAIGPLAEAFLNGLDRPA